MRDYHLHELSPDEFAALVVHLCRDLLGIGTLSFSEGPDGGKDAYFTGTARKFPSEKSPWSGHFVVQSKRVARADASCSDADFKRMMGREADKLRALRQKGEADCYLVFTNRKLTAPAESELKAQISDRSEVKNIFILGLETITSHLDINPEIVRACNLERWRTPLRVRPEDIAGIIKSFHANRGTIENSAEVKFDYDFLSIEEKNSLNRLSQAEFEVAKAESEPYFADIARFLANPINSSLREQYYDVAAEFKHKIISRRDQFGPFDEVFCFLYDAILRAEPDLRPRRLIWVFLHYMYFSCDLGEKRSSK